MAASYPGLLAAGITDLGRFDQFDLFAGESKIVTDQAQAPDGVAIAQFQVLQLNANGRMTPWLGTDVYAYGTITFTANPTAADTVTINGQAITFVNDTTPAANEVNIEATLAATLASLAALINADPTTFAVHASVVGNVVTLTALAAGTGGNAIALADSSTNTAVSGSTLTDVLATEEAPSANAVAIAAQAVPAATPGAAFPVFTGGVFNHEALVWPGGVAGLAQRKAAFMGTPIGVRQLL